MFLFANLGSAAVLLWRVPLAKSIQTFSLKLPTSVWVLVILPHLCQRVRNCLPFGHLFMNRRREIFDCLKSHRWNEIHASKFQFSLQF